MELLGEPALLKTEDTRLYWRLKREIEVLIKPENILDEMRVMDITNSVWESQRFSALGHWFEPPRVCRRPFGLSYAAIAGCSSIA
jgi:hypothetical protein